VLDIRPCAQGITFAVKVVPRAARDRLVGVEGGVLKVRLTAPPVEGAANRALVKLLAKALGVARSRVEIVGGARSRNKRVRVAGLSAGELRARLGA